MNSIDQQSGNGRVNQAAVRVRKRQRLQVQMAIRCIDELVGQDHQVRTVAAVVQTLDLSGFYVPIRSRHGHAGQSSTDPGLLVCLWLYGSIRGIGSARELARRCDPNEVSAPFAWLCGGVSVNHHMLSDFRVEHADALDQLFTQVIALLVSKGLVKVKRISQDGVRVRACAGAKSFRREQRLEELLEQSRLHVEQLRKQLEDPAYSAGVSSRHKAARKRAARDKQHRLEQAIAQLPKLKQKQQQTAKKAGNGKQGKQIKEKQLRVSSTDPQIRVMKMPNGGYNPAVNVQLASDTHSRAIVGACRSAAKDRIQQVCPSRCARRLNNAQGKKSSSICWMGATSNLRISKQRTSKTWSCSCRPNPPETRIKKARNSSPNPVTARRFSAGKNA